MLIALCIHILNTLFRKTYLEFLLKYSVVGCGTYVVGDFAEIPVTDIVAITQAPMLLRMKSTKVQTLGELRMHGTTN